jgi:hypothetical protein
MFHSRNNALDNGRIELAESKGNSPICQKGLRYQKGNQCNGQAKKDKHSGWDNINSRTTDWERTNTVVDIILRKTKDWATTNFILNNSISLCFYRSWCNVRYDFHVKTMFGSSLIPFVLFHIHVICISCILLSLSDIVEVI